MNKDWRKVVETIEEEIKKIDKTAGVSEMKVKVYDIYSYILFANIDNRDGTITGHRVILTDEQIEAIEDIVTSMPVRLEEAAYDLIDEEDK